MRPRITWDDLQIKTGWRLRNGNIRVFVSVKNASFINKTFWLENWDPDKIPSQKMMVLIAMRHAARRLINRLRPYISNGG